jgi:hypothetical protein
VPDTVATSQSLGPNIIAAEVDGGKIAENILYFVRLLRSAGLPVGPQRTVLATQAVLAAGLESPKTLYWALHSVLVTRRSEHDIFNQAFLMFWKDPGYIQQMLSLMLPNMKSEREADDRALSRRMSESLFKSADRPAPKEEMLEIEAHGTFSAAEVLRHKDFEQMSVDELRQARRAIERLRLPFEELRTRRLSPAPHGERLDMRRILKETAAKGGDAVQLSWRKRRVRPSPIVVLVDISGSMESYARIFLHFLYALAGDRDRVSAFLFGTRLTNVTRILRSRDPDAAIAKCGREAGDWSGGTRIGACLGEFNQRWARRVLGQGAIVLVFTDGLDREGGEGIELHARRLAANARRLIWLNPLMRYDGYKPLAAGAAALAKHAGEMRSCHSLASIEDLTRALAAQ